MSAKKRRRERCEQVPRKRANKKTKSTLVEEHGDEDRPQVPQGCPRGNSEMPTTCPLGDAFESIRKGSTQAYVCTLAFSRSSSGKCDIGSDERIRLSCKDPSFGWALHQVIISNKLYVERLTAANSPGGGTIGGVHASPSRRPNPPSPASRITVNGSPAGPSSSLLLPDSITTLRHITSRMPQTSRQVGYILNTIFPPTVVYSAILRGKSVDDSGGGGGDSSSAAFEVWIESLDALPSFPAPAPTPSRGASRSIFSAFASSPTPSTSSPAAAATAATTSSSSSSFSPSPSTTLSRSTSLNMARSTTTRTQPQMEPQPQPQPRSPLIPTIIRSDSSGPRLRQLSSSQQQQQQQQPQHHYPQEQQQQQQQSATVPKRRGLSASPFPPPPPAQHQHQPQYQRW